LNFSAHSAIEKTHSSCFDFSSLELFYLYFLANDIFLSFRNVNIISAVFRHCYSSNQPQTRNNAISTAATKHKVVLTAAYVLPGCPSSRTFYDNLFIP